MKKFKFSLILMMHFFVSWVGFGQVGINTSTPLSTLDINGNLNVKEIGIANVNVAGSGTLFGGSFASKTQINDGVYISIMPSGANNDFEIPNAVDVPGRIYIVRNISDTNWAFLYSAGGSFFAKNSKVLTPSPLTLSHDGVTHNKTIILISDGINWTYIF